MKNIKNMVKELNLVKVKNKPKEEVKDKPKNKSTNKPKEEYKKILGKKYLVYREDSNGYWEKYDYNVFGNEVKEIYYESSTGYWYKTDYKVFNNEVKRVYFENSNKDKKWMDEEDKLELRDGVYYYNGKEMRVDEE